jgi:type I restriction enzyme M protein
MFVERRLEPGRDLSSRGDNYPGTWSTGISTYIWIVTNRKADHRRGKIQLINAVEHYRKMRKSLGNKRNELGPEQIEHITQLYGDFEENDESKIFDNEDFGYHKIVVERPLRLSFQVTPERIEHVLEQKAFQNLAKSRKKGAAAVAEIEAGQALQEAILDVLRGLGSKRSLDRDEFEKMLSKAMKAAEIKLSTSLKKAVMSSVSERDDEAELCTNKSGNPEPDSYLRDTENVPLKDDIQTYFEREVVPHVPDAWIDESKTKVGYEIPLTRQFYKYQLLRPLADIEAELRALESQIQESLHEVVA